MARQILAWAVPLLCKDTALEVKYKATVVTEYKGKPDKISDRPDKSNELRPPDDGPYIRAPPALPDDGAYGPNLWAPPAKRRGTVAYPSLLIQFQGKRTERWDDGYAHLTGSKIFCVFNYKTFSGRSYSTRVGSDNSMKLMRQTFCDLSYESEMWEDLSYDQTKAVLETLRKRCNDGGVKQISLAFMSHGNGMDHYSFVTSDCKSLSMSIIHNMFSNSNCRGLHGHPKIFFGLFCRDIREPPRMSSYLYITGEIYGMQRQPTPENSQTAESGQGNDNNGQSLFEMHMEAGTGPKSASYLEPNDYEDMTTIYSCRPGTTSYRHPRKGSVAATCLGEVLPKFGLNHSVNDWYYQLQKSMKAMQTGASSEYSFRPGRDDFMLKNCYL